MPPERARAKGAAMTEPLDWTISRRRFLGLTGGLVALAACGGTKGTSAGSTRPAAGPTTTFATPSKKLSGDLRILQWSHFVPKHDQFFDPFARQWGQHVGVNVSVDNVDLAVLHTRTAAATATGHVPDPHDHH